MKKNHIQEYLNLPSTQSFLACADELIKLLETPDLSMEVSDYLKLLERKLAKVYAIGLELQMIELIYEVDNLNISHELRGIDYSVLTKLEDDAFYCDVFNPLCYGSYIKDNNLEAIGAEVTQGYLFDDISDIYNDVCPHLHTLMLSKEPKEIEDALFQLYFGFNHHWGKHCIDALRFLHHYNRN